MNWGAGLSSYAKGGQLRRFIDLQALTNLEPHYPIVSSFVSYQDNL